jgi:ssDNA-specific exonuclease RecJ
MEKRRMKKQEKLAPEYESFNIDDGIELNVNQLGTLINIQASSIWKLRKENMKLQQQLDKLMTENKTLSEENDHLQKVANPDDSDSIQVSSLLKVIRHAKSIGLLDKSVLAN